MVLTASSVDPVPWVFVTEVDPRYWSWQKKQKVKCHIYIRKQTIIATMRVVDDSMYSHLVAKVNKFLKRGNILEDFSILLQILSTHTCIKTYTTLCTYNTSR